MTSGNFSRERSLSPVLLLPLNNVVALLTNTAIWNREDFFGLLGVRVMTEAEHVLILGAPTSGVALWASRNCVSV